jgi:hypothetical protein
MGGATQKINLSYEPPAWLIRMEPGFACHLSPVWLGQALQLKPTKTIIITFNQQAKELVPRKFHSTQQIVTLHAVSRILGRVVEY